MKKFLSGLHEGVNVRTYSVRTILSEPKFLGCIDIQIFLPMVLLCAREARESSAINSKFRRQHTKLATKGATGSHYQSIQYGFNVTHP